jgi:hypothetical protein
MIDHGVQAAGRTDLVHLALDPARNGTVAALAALAAQTGGGARVFLNPAAQADKIRDTEGFAIAQATPLRGNAGLNLEGTVSDLSAQSLTLTYDGTDLTLPLSPVRADLMAGQDCVLTTLNQSLSVPANDDDDALNPTADPAYVRGWLAAGRGCGFRQPAGRGAGFESCRGAGACGGSGHTGADREGE